MSQQNSIKFLLDIQDENIFFTEDADKTVRKNKVFKRLKAKVTGDHICACPHCGSTHFVKNGWKETIVRFLPIQKHPLEIVLNKQRLLCRECRKSFMPEVSFVGKHSQISNLLKKAILVDLKENVSLTHIARQHNVSVTTVQRIFNQGYSNYVPNYHTLPEVICFDEFKSTKDSDGAMSFIFLNWKTKKIIDIVEDRKLPSLLEYFSRYTYKARNSVKFIVMDMYSPYMSLAKKMFPNAKIVIDFFHIVQSIARSFNSVRIREMNRHRKDDDIFSRRLKREWKLILMDSLKLSDKRYYCPSFKQLISPAEKVNALMNKTEDLRNAYDAYQELMYAVQLKNYSAFMDVLEEYRPKVPYKMKIVFRTFSNYKDYLANALAHNYSNGPIEGTNNFIKCIKRVAYGYRKFSNFRKRILVIKGQLEINNSF